ncbi:LLM class flavin-dependent oxidoreductase [Paenibacillus mucilaginosus]|uniref:NtaA n=3 Tax=Paenibacillus mucilaginosus TaxID=61624 RepID=H6NFU4_9BACL|nr:LLM class flavin-dependent oxidoreductase [Paenibacillus mucilaginosus]AEI43049.1 NtaA [Paenibacillus mucilaginosus KNP414]AFC30734.1 NtaA [Paenibacillus mucilaginosus 3016]AFH63054.2 monooxygenase [Paenibacillus mucilaginosus K02]MCG7215988.1 LLM class flavin-dependent oxidoreductase [Paenibacillus mucilaginosus]WDM24671.1 LLM class flavin-dependent oxidoreductase [Paenibacillus mucilaginosus]
MTTPGKKAHFNVFLRAAGHHEAAWRHPDVYPQGDLDIHYLAEMARIAEQGLMDSVFLADGYAGKAAKLEPFTQLSALASLTEHIGLIATVGTVYNEPFHVARQFASLDHISGGRAGWNIVTGAGDASRNFSRAAHPKLEERYEGAEEFVEVVKQLWDSWEDDALLYDKQAGKLIDDAKVRDIGFRGEHYAVKGPLNIPRPPQGHPVLVQAGSSEQGKELAARTAEVIFTAQQTFEAGRLFYTDVKSRLARYGRSADDLIILPGLSPIVADTEAEARDLEEELNSLIDMDKALDRMSERFEVHLSGCPLDGPVPLDQAKRPEALGGISSRQGVILDAARRENMTIRQLIYRHAGGHGHITFTGSTLQTADFIEKWLREGASDGFNILPQTFPHGLQAFVSKVLPELQNRGLFRTAYEGRTLRENLGLARPANTLIRNATV